jgi:hypothetical protein
MSAPHDEQLLCRQYGLYSFRRIQADFYKSCQFISLYIIIFHNVPTSCNPPGITIFSSDRRKMQCFVSK